MATPFNVTIGDQPYQLEVWMWNQLPQYPPFAVHPLLIHSICIEESLTEWYNSGWIIFNNELEYLERGDPYTNPINNLSTAASFTGNNALSVALAGVSNAVNPQAPFLFRTDGRNRISLRFYPVNPNDPNTETSYPRSSWEMSFDCVIYDIEDLPSETNIQKKRKFYFRSETYQYLLENNISFSTANGSGPDITRISPANLVMQNIIKTAAKFQSQPVKIGFTQKGSINAPDVPLDNFGPWDPGANNSIFYTSPANACILDDLFYVKLHIQSAKGGPVILDYGRSSVDKYWSLFSLQDLFTNSTTNQIERVILYDGLESTTPYVARASWDSSSSNLSASNIQNFVSGMASLIYTYKFAPMGAMDDSRITNRPLHNFDFAKGAFNIKIKDNTAQNVLTNLNTKATGLYSYSQGKGQILLNINQTKATGRTITNEFVPSPYYNSSLCGNKMMMDALYLNEALHFRSGGLTIRTPGKFLNVDRIGATASDPNHPFDDRFLGQWLIVKVVHYINPSAGSYVNDVVSTKLDSFANIWPNVDTQF